MPFTKPNGKRDYKRELAWEHSKSTKRVKDRAARNRARSQVGLKVGDPRVADHIKELDKGGSRTSKKNVRIVSAATNNAKEVKRKRSKRGNN